MEGLFYCFLNFFTQQPQAPGGEGSNPPQQAQKIGQEVTKFQDPPAEQEEVEDGAAKNAQDHIEPHFAVAGGHGKDEEGDGDRQPKEEIQRAPQQAQPDAYPQDAEQIVEQPYGGPQQQGPAQGGRLPGDGDPHLNGTAGTAGRPAPGGRPHRSGIRSPPPPSDPHRPG